jgi:hypothetical protein
MIVQSVVVVIMGLIMLMSVPTIINMQATTNQSLAEIKMMCQWRVLNEVPFSLEQLSEHQCFFFNSCLNTGGSITACYNAAREINCDINDKRYYCPPVAMIQK